MTTGIRRFALKAALALALMAGVGASTAEARPRIWFGGLRYAYPSYYWGGYGFPVYSSYYYGYPAWTGYSYPLYSSYYVWPGYGWTYSYPAYYGYGYPYYGGWGVTIGRFGVSIGGLGGIYW
jgi:glycosyltransferase involved in cell wall biosynthesis